ncbi:hypothetical protein P8452_66455 [Trifolium repens]|nr:hypothetical protein P8452_66455 [Trifolium repens]
MSDSAMLKRNDPTMMVIRKQAKIIGFVPSSKVNGTWNAITCILNGDIGLKRSDREMERNWIGVDVEEVSVLFHFLSSPSFFSSRWWRIMLLAKKKICRWKDQFAFESIVVYVCEGFEV